MTYLSATKLLPATIAAIVVVLALKVSAIATAAACAAPAACGPSSPPATPPSPSPVAASSPPGAVPSGISPQPPVFDAPQTTPAAAGTPEVAPTQFTAPTDADKALLEALRTRRSEIDTREADLAQRTAAEAATEKRLDERLGELSSLASRLQALEKSLNARDQANWQGMVKMYEAMRPRDAAAIFNDLTMPVLLEVMDRMKPAKAAPIMAAMNPEKARQVTADLATKRTQSVTLSN